MRLFQKDAWNAAQPRLLFVVYASDAGVFVWTHVRYVWNAIFDAALVPSRAWSASIVTIHPKHGKIEHPICNKQITNNLQTKYESYNKMTTTPIVLDYLAKKNAHERDARIQFEEATHIYTVDGDRTFMSVTTWNHHHFPKFDADKIIRQIISSPKHKTDPTYKY